MNEPKCPELEKMKAISDKSNIIGEFIEWLSTKNMAIGRFDSFDDQFRPIFCHKSTEKEKNNETGIFRPSK